MKTLSFFLLIFLANLSLFAQKDSLYLLEKQGDSLFLAGQNDQASRVYFRAFLKDILNQRLQDKFGLRNMEQYFSREGYRPFFVKDSTEKANFNLIRQADSLLKVCELEKSLNLYQKITKLKIDTILAKERTKMITQIIDYQENKKDSLASVLVQVVEGIAEQERFNPKLSITDFQKKTYDITSVGDGIYQTALPLGKFVITAEKWGDHEETTEQLMITNFKPHHSLIKMYMVCYLFSINDINFIKNTPQFLSDKDSTIVENTSKYLEDKPMMRLKIEAHCSTDEKNAMRLSLKRAVEVVKQLVNFGIAPHRLVLEYFGADSPIVPNDSESNKALNRRVEFKPIFPTIRN